MSFDNPYHAPGKIYSRLTQVETLIDGLNWSNLQASKRTIIVILGLVVRDLKSIARNMQRIDIASPQKSIAVVEIVTQAISTFRDLAEKDLNSVKEPQVGETKKKLKQRFTGTTAILTRRMSELQFAMKKLQDLKLI